MKIVADSAVPYLEGVFEPFGEVSRLPFIGSDDVRDADVLIVRTRTRCDERLLAGSSVRLVATATAGTDHIDLEWCSAHGIEIVSAPGCNARAVLQWVVAGLAWWCVPAQGHYSDPTLPPTRHSEPTKWAWNLPPRSDCPPLIGIVGIGHVGSLVADYAESWGFEVMRRDPEKGFDTPLEEIAERCDIITFHVPLTAETRGMAGAYFFNHLKPNALIINASRGEVVDGAALMRSCHPCLIDVWENEPNVDPRFVEYASIATPHIAGYSVQGKANATAAVVRAVAQRFGIGSLADWYPAGINRPAPRRVSWAELLRNNFYDIVADSRALKVAIKEGTPAASIAQNFEHLRTGYHFREESF